MAVVGWAGKAGMREKRARWGRPPLDEERRNRTITCYLECRQIARLDELAGAQGRSRNDLIREAVRAYLGATGDGGGRAGREERA